ncbi:CPBP family intramembrane glutamic endopeptidase [Nocardiopsis sp. MG754419]|uniref:CPBP family intramembrane glutamic endopeptidase n=1 Tax=Nocardiopsis sp. MG754419 TaxID=2259865 RepID=UPI001BA5E0AB|nr:type II CAAX endopeptidase family protein [Nocardiopsis sp. MG754419]MBR8745357.1 CPBP family intramembrane metalloprotease domain-containing protein [Nocardiopsis sp. MG754419]
MNREDDQSPPPASPQPHEAPTVPPVAGAEQEPPQAPGASPAGATAPRRRRGPRPVPPGVEYHRVLAREKRGIWRGIAALTLLMVGMLVFAFGFAFLGMFVDLALGRPGPMNGGGFTPVAMAASLLGLVLLLPWSMLVQRWLYGVRGASLHSVRSLFRMEVFGRSLLVVLPIWTVYLTVFTLFTPYPTTAWAAADLIAMFGIVVLLAPLQSAGEEYGFRGLAFRVAASWGRGPRTALVLGVVVSSLLFMVAHLALDPWLNLYYFVFGATLALITWRTGGLELAVVVHAVNNTLAFLLSLTMHTDFEEGMERTVGAGSAVMLLPCVLLVGITAVVWFRTRDTGPATTPAEHHSEPTATSEPARGTEPR